MTDVLEVWFAKRKARDDKSMARVPNEKRMSRLFLNGDIVQSVVLNPMSDFLDIKDTIFKKNVKQEANAN